MLQNFPFISDKYIVKIIRSPKVMIIQNDAVLIGFVNERFLFRGHVQLIVYNL